jgi:nitroreductase
VETWDAIRARRNVRRFEDRPIPREDLERILDAGRRAPSSRNLQRWDFVVVTDREQLGRLSGVWRGAGPVAGSAATIALIAPDELAALASINFDLGQATMAMMLRAADLGVGSGHSAVADQDLARAILGFPEDRICAWLVPMGYPADRPLRPLRRPDRRPLEDVVHWDRW